jgi:hemerythrin-like metal-binding protein
MRVHWVDNMAIGQPAMDAEHREVIRLLDAVCVSVEARLLEAAQRSVREFAEFTMEHFANEERLALTVPQYDNHRHHAIHDIAGQMINALQNILCDTGDFRSASAILDNLVPEIIVQIYQDDSDLARELFLASMVGCD